MNTKGRTGMGGRLARAGIVVALTAIAAACGGKTVVTQAPPQAENVAPSE